ncbi:fungal trichothecene efflux pump [Coleophoma crateriformis]|uniref:Fungal trichothecene efflux pump n=1 Tax=Coleophoma crateriformis TaxID=565419 RepID=A0A3D8SAS5_9HELO|nr:fungal trichothecene efflux pump [Coleophoma crateriformis]
MSTEKADEMATTTEHVNDIDRVTTMQKNAVQQTHTDGTVDYVDAKAFGGDLEAMPPGYFYSVQFIGTVVAVCCASICAYLGWVLPANTLLLINEDIGPSPNLNWVATVWTLGTAVGFLLVGRLSDIFGRKWMVMGTSVLGLVGNIIGCTAQSINTLIAANACNGVAAAGQLSFGIVLGELVPNKQRGPIVTLVFLSSLPFAVFGPIIARSFILYTSAGWRWSYYLGIILSVVALLLYQFLYHPPTYKQLHVEGKSKWQQVKELDFVGMFLFISGTVLFLIGLSWGGGVYPWKSAAVICTIVIGALLIVVLGIYESWISSRGHSALIPPRLFKNVGYVAVVACATIGAMVYYSMTILWPTIIGTVYTTDVKAIGWQSSVVGGGILLGQVCGGFALSYIPKVKWQTVIMACLALAFSASLTTVAPGNHSTFIALGVLACWAIGYIDNITFPGVTLVIEPQDIGLATGVLGSIRALGGAVAQALYVSILTNKVSHYLPEYVTPAALNAGLPASSLTSLYAGLTAGSFAKVPGITPAILAQVGAAVTHAYVSSFRIVFFATIPFSVLLIVAAFFVPNMEKFLGNNVAKRLQGKVGGNEQVAEKNETV